MSEIYKPRTQEQIYEAMKKYIIASSSTLNNFNTGSRISVLLEAISILSSETQNDFFQALLKAIPISIYYGFDFARKSGTKASGKLRFARATSAAQDFPIAIGTTVMLNGIKYETTESGLISQSGVQSAEIASSCTSVGTQGNININTLDTLAGQGSFINQPEGIESCKNSSAFVGGAEEESDTERANRFRLYINGLARSTHKGILYAVLSIEGVLSATVVELLPEDGYITIFADDGTGHLTQQQIDDITKIINGDKDDFDNFPGYIACGVRLVVEAPTIIEIDITGVVTIPTISELTDQQVIDLATSAVQTYTNSLRISNDWVHSEAITAIQNMHRDIYDIVISVPSDNVVVDDGELAKTDTITFTVVRI